MKAYNSANNLPDLIYAVISGGALGLAFIPILTETLDKEGREAMWSLFSRVANYGFIVTASLALTLVIFADPLVRNIVVPGFPPAQQDLTIQLMRLNVIALMIFSLSGLVIGVLQANQHFFLPALAPILYNIGQIVGVVFLAPRFGIFGLAYGVSAALDAYNSANNLPDLIYAVISGGALGLAFIPILTETLDKEGREAMWSLFSR
ncbi:MAG: hypothetical protein HZB77_11765, partial [Chloroflexi bacterium]|nr:hypothetical protein [Chloroflexota bacterium]